MADEKRFVWLTASSYPRRGPMLEKGKEYLVEVYGEAVVAEWVKHKAARYVTEKTKGGGE